MARTVKYANCDKCGKKTRTTDMARHKRTCKVKKDRKKKASKARNFFLTFQKPIKYRVAMKLEKKKGGNIQSYIIGNEWGMTQKNGHSHALVCTTEKMNFEEFKKMWNETTKTTPNDVQSAKNVKCSIQYVSKEDVHAVHKGIDQDYLSLNAKAYMVAQEGPFNPMRYPYPNLCRSQQSSFKELIQAYRKDIETDFMDWDNFQLYPWQQTILNRLMKQNDREVLWINDPEGNHGKTTLGKYLSSFHSAQIMNNGQSKDLAHAFDNAPVVVMDYSKDKQEFINYSFLENLKNGILFSPKYESQTKMFKPVKLLCLANYPPQVDKMVMDRWRIYTFQKTKHGDILKHQSATEI